MLRNAKRSALLTVVLVAALAGAAHATTTPANVPNSLRDYAATDASRDVLVRVDEALNALTYTYYSLSDYWNDATGVYKTDCSGYLNRMIEDAAPEAYDRLLEQRDTSRPLAEDYYYFLKSIPYGETRYRWKRVKKASELRPGDVLVWKYKTTPSSGTTGHAMIVVGMPARDERWSNVWKVRVSDSARSGHSNDNRGSSGSGVGAGEILLKVDSSSGAPYAYAWNLYGSFRSDAYVAAGRTAY